MRIAYCIGALNMGGIGTVAKNLSKYFEGKGDHFDIITTHHKGNNFDNAVSNGWKLIDISKNEASLKKRLIATYQLLLDYDVVINNHSVEVLLILPALPVKQVKISVQHNTTETSSKELSYNSQYLNYWAGVSPSVIEVVKKQNPTISNLAVLPNGVQEFSFKKIKQFKKGTIRLGYVGRLDQKQKNIFLLPTLILELEKANYRVELYIAGSGEHENKLKEKFNKMSPKGKVTFMGRIDAKEIDFLFQKCDFLLNPSYWEGLPMVVLEAMSSGLIPVLSDIGPHKFALGDELSKVLIIESNIASYVTVILKMRKDKNLFINYREQVRIQWKNNFSINAFGSNYDNLIQKAKLHNLDYSPINIHKIKLPLKQWVKTTMMYTFVQKIHRKTK
jgi:glycosyltransferase involved in cell wall biosynthesis